MELPTWNDGIENKKLRTDISHFCKFVGYFLFKMKVKIVVLGRTTVSFFMAANLLKNI